jgi:hypothetical protein
MDAIAYAKLESALVSARIPRSLWPRYFEKEEHRLLRKRCRDEDEYRRLLSERLQNEHGERQRRERWALFVILLLWLHDQKEQNARRFVQTGWRALMSSEHGRNDPDAAQTALAAITMAKYQDPDAVQDALWHGATASDGRSDAPLKAALRAIEKAGNDQPAADATVPEPKAAATDFSDDPANWSSGGDDGLADPKW